MCAQVMSDWLSDKKLDRKQLGVLSANLAAVEAWEEFESEEALNVLEELVADVAGEPREAPTPLQLLEGTSDDEVRAPGSMACHSYEAFASGSQTHACAGGSNGTPERQMTFLLHSRCLHGIDHTSLAAFAGTDVVPALQSGMLQGCRSTIESARSAEGHGVCWAQVKEEINAPELAAPEDALMPHATEPAALPNGDAHAASDAPEASGDWQAQDDAPGGITVAVKTEAGEEQKPAFLLLEAGSAVKVPSLRSMPMCPTA